jgi:hypothetical protein
MGEGETNEDKIKIEHYDDFHRVGRVRRTYSNSA